MSPDTGPAELTAKLPRVALATFPTPLEDAPRLAALLGGPRLVVKREDLAGGLALGGNKARQLEFIMAEALGRRADAVLTTAAAQSNFCRATASAARRLGLHVGLLLRGGPDEPVQGNLLLDRLLGAEIRWVATRDPYDPAILDAMATFEADLRARGLSPYTIHLPGRTGALAAAAYVSAAEELCRQWRAFGLEPAALYVAAGSGLTLAGLVLGLKHLGSRTRVIGVSAQKPRGFMVPLIVERANEAARLLGLATEVGEEDFDFDDGRIGEAYGVPTVASVAAVRRVAECEGLLLDPVYTGKAMAGLMADVAQGRWGPRDTVIFLASGGAPALFVHGQALVVDRDAVERNRTPGALRP